MKGVFSRRTFDPEKGYTAVLTQQGRVALDADANEAQDITRQRHATTARDVVGLHTWVHALLQIRVSSTQVKHGPPKKDRIG